MLSLLFLNFFLASCGQDNAQAPENTREPATPISSFTAIRESGTERILLVMLSPPDSALYGVIPNVFFDGLNSEQIQTTYNPTTFDIGIVGDTEIDAAIFYSGPYTAAEESNLRENLNQTYRDKAVFLLMGGYTTPISGTGHVFRVEYPSGQVFSVDIN